MNFSFNIMMNNLLKIIFKALIDLQQKTLQFEFFLLDDHDFLLEIQRFEDFDKLMELFFKVFTNGGIPIFRRTFNINLAI